MTGTLGIFAQNQAQKDFGSTFIPYGRGNGYSLAVMKRRRKDMVELLAPAGSYESLYAAVNAGADAVYIGGSRFGARAYADNPEEDVLLRGIDYCHLHGRKLYLTVNTLLKERELEEQLYNYIRPYYCEGLDGVIVQDFGVVRFLKEYFPQLPIHASTQMTVTGADGAEILKKEGLTRIVPARELSLDEIRDIITKTGLEVETFIHGAMCYCYSGQCLFSSMIGGRSGNRGRCAQPCRLPYQLQGSTDKKKSYVLSMKDMCVDESIGELIDAGITSFKIEGRMKRPEYTAGVVSVYRRRIDQYLETGKKRPVPEEEHRILLDLYNRGGFSNGYYHQYNGPKQMSMERPNHFGTAAAKVLSEKKGMLVLEALEPLYKGDVLELHDSEGMLTLGQEVRKGKTVSLRAAGIRCRVGSTLYRTKCAHLLESLEEQYLKRGIQEKIKGELMISIGRPAILSVSCGKETVTVCSEQTASAAQTRPVQEADIRRQMEKTGNTPFVFEQLDVTMEGELFFPLREINELRRRALGQLEKSLPERDRRCDVDENMQQTDDVFCSAKKRKSSSEAQAACQNGVRSADEMERKAGQFADEKYSAGEEKEPSEFSYSVSVMTKEQLEAVLNYVNSVQENRIRTIYLDLLIAAKGRYQADAAQLHVYIQSVKASNLTCRINLPPVLRQGDRTLLEQEEIREALKDADGFLVHTLDELGFVQRVFPGAFVVSDDTFYAYNRRAQQFLREHGISQLTLPAELNARELQTLDTCGSELIVYGYQAFMHSAQCVFKNTSGCTAHPEVLWMKDRKQSLLPVRNRCVTCCNTIYNALPLDLGGCEKEIQALAPESLRLSFTIENGEEMGAVLERFGKAGLRQGDTGGTRGHFRRGVE